VFAALPGNAAAFPLIDPPERIAADPGYPTRLLDFNGDGLLDIAGVGGQGVSLALGTETGFAAAQAVTVTATESPRRALAVDDMTGDGRDDLVVTFAKDASMALLRGRADGVLTAPAAADSYSIGTSATYWPPTAVNVADIDGDDDLDVAAALGVDADTYIPPNTDENGTVTVFLNDGDGDLTPTGQALSVNAPADLLLVPLAGDNDPELIVSQSNRAAESSVKLFPGSTGGSFGAGVQLAAGKTAGALDWADFNEDDRPDLVVAHGTQVGGAESPVSVLPGAAAAAALGARIDVQGANGTQVAAADLDRDGHDDLYVADGRLALPFEGGHDDPIFIRGLGNLGFTGRDQPRTEFERFEHSPQVADLDADGKLDVLTAGSYGNTGGNSYFIRYGMGPQLVPDPAEIDFGNLTVGDRTATQDVVFTNIGPGTAAGITRQGVGDTPDFAVEQDGCTAATLTVGQSCTLAVAFAPSAAGDREALFSTFAADADFLYEADLWGTGESPVSQPSVTSPVTAAPMPSRASVTRTTLKTLLRRGLRFTQRFPVRGRVRWTLELSTRTRGANAGRQVTIGRAVRTVSRPGVRRVVIKLTRQGRRLARRVRPRQVVLRTSFTAAGASRAGVLALRVRLRR